MAAALGTDAPQALLADDDGALRPGGLALTGHAVALAGVPRGAVAVDVGAGTGASARYLAARFGLRCSGIEPDGALAGQAGAAGLPVLRGVAEALPLATGGVDLVLAECVLSVLARPEAALAEAARVLRPGGVLVVTDLYDRSPDERACEPAPAVPTRARVLDAVLRSGLRPAHWEDHSDALRRTAVRLLWAGARPDALTCSRRGAAAPGYYLLLARSPGGAPWTT